ncbi:MAG: TetR/AcrR family transcriptional regulator [Acidobacteria bacterium]|nr:TetR/AcrR family transcriptional regulator [Acidobacteriota bacterium]
MPRPARVSPDRILDAAALEFAARGYAGARVDHIARRGRVNKAMLYYHFGSKQGLYRALLRRTFGAIAADLQAIASGPLDPASRLDAAVSAFVRHIETHAHFPSIMLREVAEGGTHLDADTMAAVAAVPQAFAAILKPGVEDGVFDGVHPLSAYFITIAPIVMFVASAPLRAQAAQRRISPTVVGRRISTDAFMADVKRALQRAFAARSSVHQGRS